MGLHDAANCAKQSPAGRTTELSPTLHVACVADARYGPYAGIALSSVIRSNPGTSVHVHAFSDGIQPKDVARLQRFAAEQGAACSIYDITPSLDNFPALQAKFHYSRAACGRLFIAD